MLDDYSARWEPRIITKALLQSAGHSLVSLKLTARGFKGVEFRKDEPFIGSLRQFRVSQRVVIDTMLLFKKEVIVVDLPTTVGMFVPQKAWMIAVGMFVPQQVRTIPNETFVFQTTRTTIVVHRLIDFLPKSIKTFVVTCEFVGCGFSKSDIEIMFTDPPKRTAMLPTPSHIEFVWKEEDDEYGLWK